uniref:Condensation domain-containing protein n=1 Tax=Alexandrium catenella TaxID=2925 RepID=A0A7S1RL84_ALECA
MVVALSCAFARADDTSIVPLTLTVPMRDEPLESALVGLFTDWRDVDLSMPASEALASVALRAAELLRRRRWRRGLLPEVHRRILLNLVSAEQAPHRGFHHRAELGSMRPPSRNQRVHRRMERPMEVQGWQTGLAEWTLVVSLDGARHPPAWADRFVAELQRVIEQLACDPFAPVHACAACHG